MSDFVPTINKIQYAFQSLEEAFPAVDPGHEPLADMVLVQLRVAKKKTKGGIILDGLTQDSERSNTQVAKVLSMGPLTYCDQHGTKWDYQPVSVGDFVRVPKFGGDQWTVKYGDGPEDEVVIRLIPERMITAKVTGDPRTIKAFL